ncbi:hypothetical protein PIB30_052720 [Stylosanthes scabra]|uniref:G-type lectin S-receptor-like serine/threonine-protein kinase SD1-1 n=1 Tax=Stylosanthes scabra TaxID=79078 RepID=A0ABU6QI00_9FABA|nr:hypothetical protein [Stylosanthes scabra]
MEVLLNFILINLHLLLLLVLVSADSSSSSSSGLKNDTLCDFYGFCGANGNCDLNNPKHCSCLDGFTPKDPTSYDSSDFRLGCVKNKAWNCSTDVFVRYSLLHEPNGTYSMFGGEDCKGKCSSNCSCIAYVIIGSGGCKLWSGDLFNVRFVNGGGQDLYIRTPASDQGKKDGGGGNQGRNEGLVVGIVVGSTIIVICGMIVASCYFLRKRTQSKELGRARINEMVSHNIHTNEQKEDLGLPLFDLGRIVVATSNFSPDNKLGEGGFGPVYKGILDDGRQIAVKRLSSSSGQGLNEFKTEVKLIAKLQHRNLVKLFGCCIQEKEKMLIYEYMPNRSLDYFIFDHSQKNVLDWPKLFNIICGIARGLLYLHQDSRLRIIHRDLKASNILLDSKLGPKISDFGLARSFGGDQSNVNTNRVVGTFGYMAPEYAVNGQFSVKSDVFSFGILLLEIVSGKRNKKFYYANNDDSLYGHAWELWKQGRSLELVDESLKDSWNLSEVQRCIHIGLLCAQQYPHDRPTMSSVVLMLGSEFDLPQPEIPTFFIVEPFDASSSSTGKNDLSITEMEAR